MCISLRSEASRGGAVWARLALAAMVGACAHCGDGGDTTGRVRVTFPVAVRGINAESDSSLGWHVSVERAFVAVGPVRWYEGPPIFGLNVFERLVGVRLAYAHPGHYVPGEALADVTAQRVIDLMAPSPTALDTATGVSGEALSARIELHPPGAELGLSATPLHGLALWTRGTATRGGVTVRFEGGVAVDYAVRGVPARATLGPAGSFLLSVDLAQWFDRADFSTLPPAAPGEAAPITATSEVANGLYRGATNGAAYIFAWTTGAPDR